MATKYRSTKMVSIISMINRAMKSNKIKTESLSDMIRKDILSAKTGRDMMKEGIKQLRMEIKLNSMMKMDTE